MMYALNREVEYFDMPQVRQIVRDAAGLENASHSTRVGRIRPDLKLIGERPTKSSEQR